MPQKNDVILSLNQEAQDLAKKGVDVTNGAIGMMYLDDGHLPVSEEIRTLLSRHTQDQDLIYPSVAGTKDYLAAVRKWFLGSSFEEEAKSGNFLSLGTPGGTGAVCLSFALSRGKNNAVVIPSLGWPNYVGIAKGFGLDIQFYSLFAHEAFDVEGLKKNLLALLTRYEHLSLLINDPCQNPTGYSLSPEEWKALAAIFQDKTIRGKVDLIVDAAYIDFAPDELREAMISALKSLPEETLCYLCFSFSKTLSFYGLRIGALSLYSKNKELLAKADDAALMEARALWSVPNHMAMNAISELLNNLAENIRLRNEVQHNREIVAERASTFLSEAREAGLKPYPYVSGFFITLYAPNAYDTCLKLKDKHIFLAPIKEDAIRIALCSLPSGKIPGLAAAIKEASHD
jgi:aromatic-amino-acid transaminase